MNITNNRFFVTLVTTNIFAFIIIFVLIWMLWENNDNTQQTVSVVADESVLAENITVEPVTPQTVEQNMQDKHQQQRNQQKSFIKQKVLSIVELVVQEVKAADLDMSQYLPNDSVDAKRGQDVSQKNLSDKAYIEAFNELDKNIEPEVQYTQEQASTVKIVASLATGGHQSGHQTGNHFNKVDVSKFQSNNALTQQLVTIVSNEEAEQSGESDAALSTPAWKDYLNSLKSAEVERENEVRTIKVKRGDTLWGLATRAYGSGFLYTKIFEANPHLINPASITTGETLRVPL